MKKAAKASYNVVIGDDIRTLTSKNTKWYQKVVSGALIAANFIPVVGPAASVTAKVAIKDTVATVKAVKTTSSAKKVATAANKKPKTVAAKSIKSTPKIQESKSVKANNVTPPAKNKTNVSLQPARNNTSTRLETNKKEQVTEKAKTLAENKKAGAEAEKLAKIDLEKEGNEILGSQVSVRTSEGIRRIDHLIRDSSGNIKAVEVKSGNAKRNSSQIKKDTLMEIEGGVIIGKNAPENLKGKLIKIPTIERRY